MKFRDIFDAIKPLAGVAATINPVVGAALAAVNAFLPDEDKLPVDATGQQITDKVASLPPDQRAQLMIREVDLQIAQEEGWTERYKAMVQADGQSTRPKIALMMAKILSAMLLGFVVLLFYIAATEGMSAIMDGSLWTIFAALTATPAGILGKYFGELRKEQGQRLGFQPPGALSGLTALFNRK